MPPVSSDACKHGKEGNASKHGKEGNASKHGKEGNASKHGKEGNAMTFQYFSENLVYYAPTMLILNPKPVYSFSILPLKSVQVYLRISTDDVVSQPVNAWKTWIVAQTLGSNTAATLWTGMEIRSSIHNSSRQVQTNVTCHRQYHDIYSSAHLHFLALEGMCFVWKPRGALFPSSFASDKKKASESRNIVVAESVNGRLWSLRDLGDPSGFSGSRSSGFSELRVLGAPGSRISGFSDIRVLGAPTSWRG